MRFVLSVLPFFGLHFFLDLPVTRRGRKALCTSRNNMHEDRETYSASVNQTDRSARPQSRAADAYALQESDRGVVSMKLPNKEEESSTEVWKEGSGPKENDAQSNTHPTQSGERVSQGLSGVRPASSGAGK